LTCLADPRLAQAETARWAPRLNGAVTRPSPTAIRPSRLDRAEYALSAPKVRR